MTDTPHLGLPTIEAAQAQKHVTHNEALTVLDALVMLAVLDRDLAAPPSSPAEGDRYLVKAPGSGSFAGKDNQIAHYVDGGWSFHPPRVGWTCYVQDEAALLAWNGTAWAAAIDVLGGGALQNLSLLGIGTTADGSNPFSAKLNNALWTAKTVAEGGDGNLRYKMSKESAAKTLSLLLQDNFSGRAEIGLTGDDDFHFKTSPDGSTWVDALVIDRTSGAAKLNSAVSLTADLSPAQITANQNDYNPAGLAGASVLRLSSNAARAITGMQGGADGRLLLAVNVGSNSIVLSDASTASSAANRFAFGNDLVLAPKEGVLLIYDATDSRWKLIGSNLEPPPSAGRLAWASATQIKYSPFNGNRVKIAGGWYSIPPAGVAAANTGVFVNGVAGQNLAASTLYYVYLFDNSGTLTIDFSTTGHATDTSSGNVGVEIKNGDSTRTLIGMVRTSASGQFVDTAVSRCIASWCNRRSRTFQGASTAGATTTSGSFVELATGARIEGVFWADEGISISIAGNGAVTATQTVYVSVGVDGATSIFPSAPGVTDPNGYTILSAAGALEVSEGYHYLTPIGSVSGGTGTYYVFAAAAARG